MSMHGYEGASISAIIKESGIQKSSIYWQFDSKAAIAAAVMERGAGFSAQVQVDAPDAPALRQPLRDALGAIAVDVVFSFRA